MPVFENRGPDVDIEESAPSALEVDDALKQYSDFVERRLKPDLDSVCERRDKYFEELAKLDQISKALDMLDASVTSGTPSKPPAPIETRVNIGEEFYVRAVVDDVDHTVLDVGLGVMVKVSRKEARTLISERKKLFSALGDAATERITHVQAHLKKMITSLSELRRVKAKAPMGGEQADDE